MGRKLHLILRGPIAAFGGHSDQKTTQRYIHFMPKDKRETVESIPFEF